MLCQQNCSDSNISCERQASQDARVSFRQYAKSQRKQRLPIIKSVSDFKDDSQCHASCGCDSVYRQCYQTCGGQVLANTVCVAFCDQKSK